MVPFCYLVLFLVSGKLTGYSLWVWLYVDLANYLNLSALAYVDFESVDKGKTIGSLADSIKDGNISRKAFDLDSLEFSALQDPSNPLRSFVLLDQSPPVIYRRTVTQRGLTRTVYHEYEANFSCIALQNPETKEIVFAFRGTNNYSDWPTDILIGSGIFPADWLDQCHDAVRFVFQTLSKYGPTQYKDYESMLKDIGQSSNISFTGHSLGGGLAQYMTYKTADLTNGDSGVKAITFNGVGIATNLLDIVALGKVDAYNVVDHVNSLDWVGTYGVQLGRTIRHIDNSEVDYAGFI